MIGTTLKIQLCVSSSSLEKLCRHELKDPLSIRAITRITPARSFSSVSVFKMKSLQTVLSGNQRSDIPQAGLSRDNPTRLAILYSL